MKSKLNIFEVIFHLTFFSQHIELHIVVIWET